jgi:Ni/Fe-hydrogenase subunit HybB-like protein
MAIFTLPLFWVVLALSIGVPVVVLGGARYLAARAVPAQKGGSGAMPVTLPSFGITSTWQLIRTALMLLIMATGTGLVLMRFVFGVGAVTNLSDHFALGLWISFDVMCGVALAAGAFVLAATVHIFRLHRFEPLVRPAILTGLLGYLLVIVALLVDLGRPYNVWRPLVHWQHRSVLWEVGVCVATYSFVLFVEFLPVILERVNKIKAVTSRLPTIPLYNLLKKISIAFVILGVVLSTLHQSSLGSLWVLVPEKLSAIWYSLYLPVFFWLSAVAVGLAMVIVESTLSSKAFKRGLELPLLASLGKAAIVVLGIYLVARWADLIARGAVPLVFQPTAQAVTFWLEMLAGVVTPMVMFAVPKVRRSSSALFTSAMLVVVFGVVLNRLNVGIIGLYPTTGFIYFPSWMEFVVTFTIVAAGVLVFGAAARYLPVFQDEHGQA